MEPSLTPVTIGFPKTVPNSYLYEDWVIDYWYVKAPGAPATQKLQAARSASSTAATAH